MRPRILITNALVLASMLACSTPNSSTALGTALREGEVRLANGDAMGARAAFSAATSRDPKSFIGWIGYARAAAASGDHGEAERALSRALACSPESADALDLSGRTALELARSAPRSSRRLLAQLSASLLGRARGLDPKLPHAAYHAGLAAWWTGDFIGAMNWFDEARKNGYDARVETAVAALRAEASRPESAPASRATD